MPKITDESIPAVSLDEALPSGPLRRSRRLAQKEKRAGAEKKEGDVAGRRAARVGKPRVRVGASAGTGAMTKGYRVIVSGLMPNTTEAQVRELFKSVRGRILKCTLGRQQGTNKPVGVAEVVYETSAQADRAAQVLNKATVDGRVIAVQSRGLAFFTKNGAKGATGGSKKGKSGGKKKKEGKKKEEKKPVTAESLDDALKAYMA